MTDCSMNPRRISRSRGFTLLELMIAMTLFTTIGFAVALLMTSGIDMWLSGTRGAQQEDRRELSLPRLEDDLRHMRLPGHRDRIPVEKADGSVQAELPALIPDNRFLSNYVYYKFGDREVPCRYLAFVRDIRGLGEIDVYARRAGTNPKADKYIDGIDDEEEFKKNQHLPTGGQVEVLWIWLPDPDEAGMGTVYRAYRAPIGGAGTLLDPKNFDEYGKLMREIKPQAVFQEVLLFDVHFWTQFTNTWEYQKGDPRVVSRPMTAADIEAGPRACGPSRVWDSTRGWFVGGRDEFRLNRTKKSVNFVGDDIWPRMVRVEFSLREMETQLKGDFSTGSPTFSVHDATFATGMGELYNVPMKIGNEWLRIQSRDYTDTDTFIIDRRGQRGTVAVNHPTESPVYFGRVYDVTVEIPSYRDDNN